MKRLLGSGLGVGFLPVAPGTWASAVVCGLFLLVWRVWPGALEGFGGWWIPLVSTLVLSVASVGLAGLTECPEGAEDAEGAESAGRREHKSRDPGWFVLDELAGQAVALAGMGGVLAPVQVVISFVFFRFVDIIKPWPVSRMERLPRGWGVTADDLVGGVMALAARMAVVWVWCRLDSGG